jgi:hypothetical protein
MSAPDENTRGLYPQDGTAHNDAVQGATPPARRRRRWGSAIGTTIVILVLFFLGDGLLFPYQTGPAQPLPFSHRIHAGTRQIDCFFCHDGADRSSVAGIPEVQKCLLCHNVIATGLPPIQELHAYYNRREPVPWVRVNQLPNYVHFNHQMHLVSGVDCSACHGDVKTMDRVISSHFRMGFCVDCHRKNQAPVNCSNCHY